MKAAPKMECCCSAGGETDEVDAVTSHSEHLAHGSLTAESPRLLVDVCCKMAPSKHGKSLPIAPERTSAGNGSAEAPQAVFREVVSLVSIEGVQREAARRAFSISDSLSLLAPAIPALAQSCILVI